MSNFIRCSGFSHMMLFRCHVHVGLSGCCGKNDFICNRWEERNEYRHLFLWLVQLGPEANVLRSAVRISLWLF